MWDLKSNDYVLLHMVAGYSHWWCLPVTLRASHLNDIILSTRIQKSDVEWIWFRSKSNWKGLCSKKVLDEWLNSPNMWILELNLPNTMKNILSAIVCNKCPNHVHKVNYIFLQSILFGSVNFHYIVCNNLLATQWHNLLLRNAPSISNPNR